MTPGAGGDPASRGWLRCPPPAPAGWRKT